MRTKIGRERVCKCGDYVIIRTEPNSVSLHHWKDDRWVEVRRRISRAVATQYGVDLDGVFYVFSGVRGGRMNHVSDCLGIS